ncbi:hypothetical protein CALCODRAFT_490664 [Calocera cornea HHB12733]|uniref:Sugar phosphate transporter domain-containing protein n=1 Tax=Calocera cornea HHB12733 TaxID=1353952 RepID=A0A165JF87_9BASI|nr:hypothetical protein CALCODRAFT_490664 [Calocera cornea HHB12733]
MLRSPGRLAPSSSPRLLHTMSTPNEKSRETPPYPAHFSAAPPHPAHHSRASSASSALSSSSQTPLFAASTNAYTGEETYSKLQVTAVVSFYMMAALVMVFVNKIILNDTPSLVVTTVFIQALVTVLLVHVTALARPSKVQIPHFSLQTAISLTPVILGDVLGFTLNAFCLREVDATLYQVARGLALPFTILVSSVSTRSAPTRPVLLCAFAVTLGFLLGVTPPLPDPLTGARTLNITPLGVLYGLAASLTVAVQAVLIKRSLPHVKGSALQLAYWRNLGSALLLLLFMLARGELRTLHTLATSGTWDWTTFAWGNLVTGIVGFLICVAGTLSVKVTSPVTHMFSSAARSVLQLLIAVHLFADSLTPHKLASIAIILAGTLAYSHVQAQAARDRDSADMLKLPAAHDEKDVEKQ